MSAEVATAAVEGAELNERARLANNAVARARRAREILEGDLFRGAVEAVREKLTKEFESSGLDDDDTRRRVRWQIDLLQRLVGELSRHMTNGTLAKEELSRIEKRRGALGRVKDRFG